MEEAADVVSSAAGGTFSAPANCLRLWCGREEEQEEEDETSWGRLPLRSRSWRGGREKEEEGALITCSCMQSGWKDGRPP